MNGQGASALAGQCRLAADRRCGDVPGRIRRPDLAPVSVGLVGFVCGLVTWTASGLFVVDSRAPSTQNACGHPERMRLARSPPSIGPSRACCTGGRPVRCRMGRTRPGFSGPSFVERQRPSADRRALLLSIGRSAQGHDAAVSTLEAYVNRR